MSSTSTAPGVVAGRYRLLAVLGTGGMGRVWRAHDDLLDRAVAVKQLTTADQEQTVREARAAAGLDHPHVVRIYDVVRAEAQSWIVMEYVPGRSLHELVRQSGPVSHREGARIGAAMLDALRAAHEAGVLHRDVKPHNVLIGSDGRVVLTDFGLATRTGWPAPAGALLGSPHYVAPERLRDQVSSEAADLWSLGATLYAAVEGRPPFARPTVADSLTALMGGEPHAPQRPGPLHTIIAGLLTKDPKRRTDPELAYAQLLALANRAVGVSRVPTQRKTTTPAAAGPVPTGTVSMAASLPTAVPAKARASAATAEPTPQAAPTAKAKPTTKAATSGKAASAVKAAPIAEPAPAAKAAPSGKAAHIDEPAPTAKAAPTTEAAPLGEAVPAAEAAPTAERGSTDVFVPESASLPEAGPGNEAGVGSAIESGLAETGSATEAAGATEAGNTIEADSAVEVVNPVVGPVARVPSRGRRVRGRVAAAAAAGVVLAGVAGAVISLAGGSDERPAVPTTPAAVAVPAGPCGDAMKSAVSVATKPKVVVLPAGWVWHRDSNGFALPLPAGWQRSVTGTTACFTDPSGQRSFTVDTAAPVTREPLAYWQNAEKAAAGLRDYQRVSMGVLLLKRGGADWEYSWQPAEGPSLHTRRVLLATTATKSFLLQWTTTEPEWTPGLPLQQHIVATFF